MATQRALLLRVHVRSRLLLFIRPEGEDDKDVS